MAEKYYVGKTNNLDDRLERHQKGQVSFTSFRLPFELVTYIAFNNEWKATEMRNTLKPDPEEHLQKGIFC